MLNLFKCIPPFLRKYFLDPNDPLLCRILERQREISGATYSKEEKEVADLIESFAEHRRSAKLLLEAYYQKKFLTSLSFGSILVSQSSSGCHRKGKPFVVSSRDPEDIVVIRLDGSKSRILPDKWRKANLWEIRKVFKTIPRRLLEDVYYKEKL